MRKKVINTIVFIVVFSIGITFGKLLNWGYFELSKEISVVDSLSLFITIGLAIYITKILEKEVQDIRIEKELYIAKITELEESLKSFDVLIEEHEIIYNKITNRIHSCRIKKNSIFGNIKDSLKQIKTSDIDLLEKEITDKINSLKRLLTETSAVPDKIPELSVKKGIATFSVSRIIEISTEINAINESLFKMKVRINNL
ncbi:hypothetical protein SAMN05216331_1344 [Porphyromonadaceae bacterium KH3R12]|uniref:hypothetical protein n=1 Tax=Proteiniphilum sp. TaxID=1926877 RepID=UPI0008995CCE|nr:hypothetical protein [Proteiniphilum sp.]MDY9918552.1 hypothetical protein [Proteiniphilum sp.]OJV86286.1 MAG: hypothetical protein BGO34_04625 [Bacteroidia bacterium 44-10]SEA31564.1 hypothetical protein SAMN05216331_1344 [Porphyromonadaceae bacterium KH3R12]